MKKLFTTLFVSLCGTMVYAQSVISVNDVNIVAGSTKKMEVKLTNPSDYTAFQFDLKLPKGISVKDVSMNGTYGEDRKLEKGLINEGTNTYRFLSYDMKNSTLTGDGVVATITLEAGEEAETATLSGSDLLVVTPGGDSTPQETASATITISEGVSVTIGANKVATLVSDKDLDFSDDAVKAYIATGYDYNTNNILLTRVKDVPADTPILLMGEPSGETPYVIPVTTSRIYYPENFLKGKATTNATVDHSGDYINMQLRSGQFEALAASVTEYPASKCYLQIPASVTPAAGDAFSFTMGGNGIKSYTGKYDLDFESAAVNAYIVTGYDKDNTIWLTRVKKVSANTPLVLLGEANAPFEVPSVAQKTSYVNMLNGDAYNSIPITKTTDEWTNLILKSGQFVGLPVDSYDVPAGSSYLPIPTSIIAASRGEFVNDQKYNMVEAEVITMKAIIGGENGGATAISRVASEVGNDVWYNLNGQRIDTPTKKGLYIKNGKKVIVK